MSTFQLKGKMTSITVLRLTDASLDTVEEELAAKVAASPDFFRDMPLVFDLGGLGEAGAGVNLHRLVRMGRDLGFIPVALQGGSERQNELARGLSLGTSLGERRGVREPDEPEAQAHCQGGTSMLVTQPVRSGQQIYANGGDLVILSSVSPGAEVLADGHIHVYGSLKGRALAGVQGDRGARIFCHKLEAELVSIAGDYLVSEEIGEDVRGKSVQIHLDGDRLAVAVIA